MLKQLFLDHPHSVDESYREHLVVAGSFGLAMIGGGIACLVHAVLPCVFTRTGSGVIRRLHARMVAGRTRRMGEAVVRAAR